jgi:hypothetical protein
VPADRITRVRIEHAPSEPRDWVPAVFDWKQALWSFAKGVIVVALVAAAIAAVAPERMAALRKSLLARPFRAIWIGFLAESTAIGAVVLLALTIIGLMLAPVALAAVLLGGFLGYVVAAYALGVGLMLAIGRPEPATLGERALSAAAGALLAGLIALIPWIGWLFVLAAVLAGLGALTTMVFRPAFFADSGGETGGVA